MWVAATVSQPPASSAGTERAAEGEEDLLGDVLGLVAGAEHAGGDGDDPRVVAAEDLLEVGPDVVPCPVTCPRPAQSGAGPRRAARGGARLRSTDGRTSSTPGKHRRRPGCDSDRQISLRGPSRPGAGASPTRRRTGRAGAAAGGRRVEHRHVLDRQQRQHVVAGRHQPLQPAVQRGQARRPARSRRCPAARVHGTASSRCRALGRPAEEKRLATIACWAPSTVSAQRPTSSSTSAG